MTHTALACVNVAATCHTHGVVTNKVPDVGYGTPACQRIYGARMAYTYRSNACFSSLYLWSFLNIERRGERNGQP